MGSCNGGWTFEEPNLSAGWWGNPQLLGMAAPTGSASSQPGATDREPPSFAGNPGSARHGSGLGGGLGSGEHAGWSGARRPIGARGASEFRSLARECPRSFADLLLGLRATGVKDGSPVRGFPNRLLSIRAELIQIARRVPPPSSADGVRRNTFCASVGRDFAIRPLPSGRCAKPCARSGGRQRLRP